MLRNYNQDRKPKKGIERVNIYVDGEFAFSCSTEIVYSEGLKSGIALDSDKLGEIVSEDEYLNAKIQH